MRKDKFVKIVAIVLAALMVLSIVPLLFARAESYPAGESVETVGEAE